MSEINGAAITILTEAPDGGPITEYDVSHFLTYARLIDAERAGTDWREAASEILLCAVEDDPAGSRRCWESHLARAHGVVKGPVSI
ncbi:hypothetical protein [Novosphingobium mathurense]|uniref:Uncharacterized protein n=1 Tax=Novosphingobium mathurense TaxID=428990 RepID=A0A1U6ILE6_9SPHN|nr:hypothetical protein [Novosphingobium mathurense]SLK08782.1 hypothetical protein SAMN06295987_108134 [Novosphingobium mathurense]